METIKGTALANDHFDWQVEGKVGTVTINRPDRKNPLTFGSYAALRDTFRALRQVEDVKTVVITGAGGNFCSGGDVNDIIGPLLKMDMKELVQFTEMTGDVVKAMRACPQPIIAAVEGVCAGAGAILAMGSDLRYGTVDSKIAFLFTRVGLAGCDMGACSILPRIIGQGRASELLYTGRSMSGEEAFSWGFYNKITEPGKTLIDAQAQAARLADGPTFAHGITKRQLHMEWNMSVDDAISAEAEAQAICMQTQDFHRAYKAFMSKEKPVFKGN